MAGHSVRHCEDKLRHGKHVQDRSPAGSRGYGVAERQYILDRRIELPNGSRSGHHQPRQSGDRSHAIVVDPYYVSAIGSQHKGCYVQSHYSDLRDDFPDTNQITRKGSGWRDYVESGDLTTMAFSVGSADCRAIEKRGPTWLGGHVFVIHASVCRKDGHALEPRDMDLALGSLQVRVYEARGNLRAAPQ